MSFSSAVITNPVRVNHNEITKPSTNPSQPEQRNQQLNQFQLKDMFQEHLRASIHQLSFEYR